MQPLRMPIHVCNQLNYALKLLKARLMSRDQKDRVSLALRDLRGEYFHIHAEMKRLSDEIHILRMERDDAESALKAHQCPPDYAVTYTQEALRTEHTRAFANDADGYPDLHLSLLLHAATGLVTEAGEVLDCLKKTLVYGKPVDEVNLLEEAGDIKWYLALLLRTLGKTDREAGEKNIQKLLVRYPNAFSEAQAQKPRDLAAERAVFEPRTIVTQGLRSTLESVGEVAEREIMEALSKEDAKS